MGRRVEIYTSESTTLSIKYIYPIENVVGHQLEV